MRRPEAIAALLVLGGIVQLSCESPSGPAIAPELLWHALHLANYSVNERFICFCPGSDDVVRITVRGDSIAGAVNAATGAPLPPSRWGRYKTIDELFAIIDAATRDTSIHVEARYDTLSGYPTWLFVDPIPGAADDEYAYTVSRLSVVPGLP